MKLTTAEVAALLGITPQGVRMLVMRGQLSRRGTVRRSWYDVDEVRQLERTRRRRIQVALQVSGV